MLSEDAVMRAMTHMNEDHRQSLLTYAQQFGGCEWAESAEMTALSGTGFDLAVRGGERSEVITIAFPEPVGDMPSLRAALVDMAMKAQERMSEGESDGVTRVSTAVVETSKASRYLKALCNHFNRKVTARYTEHEGHVAFPFGECEMKATETTLHFEVRAESEGMLNRTKAVVGDHLIRFSQKEALRIHWQ